MVSRFESKSVRETASGWYWYWESVDLSCDTVYVHGTVPSSYWTGRHVT